MAEKVILLVNLGSPDSTKVSDVRDYLNEFLSDKRVLDMPFILRKLLLNIFILPTRPAKTAKKYETILIKGKMPLKLYSEGLVKKLNKTLDYPVFLAMRYAKPSIKSVLQKIVNENLDLKEILLCPMYPHYASSSYETVVVKFQEELSKISTKISKPTNYKVLQPFFANDLYVSSLCKKIKPYLKDYDFILFSYHGIPERHVKKADLTKTHCLQTKDCCQIKYPSHATCYRHQCLETTSKTALKLNLPEDKFQSSFQSRFLKDPWLQPYTTNTIKELAQRGVKKLLVVCPAFISDCLETLEEINIEEKQTFIENGGNSLTMIPCLNDDDLWVKNFSQIIKDNI